MPLPAIFKTSFGAALLVGSVGLLGWAGAACGSSSGGSFSAAGHDAGNGGPNNGLVNLNDGGFSLDALAAEDPPNQWCGPDAEAPPATTLGGSPDCPTDKNLEGCPCAASGETAACWPGLRKNRDVGDCKDGTTTCSPSGEVGNQWGPCVGAVLPDPTATSGPAACDCFSEGQWHIDNLVPYFITYNGDAGPTIALSTTQDPDGGATVLPVVTNSTPDPPPEPAASWSTDELTVDCAGTFTLCYELKYGNFNNPLPTDCSITKVCLPATYYGTANVSQVFPPLPPWEATAAQSSCAVEFNVNGGYGEMSVLGESVLCQEIDDGSGHSFVFHRIEYCPASNTSCGQDGRGTFN
jgi:hypothetical protein